MNAGHVGTLGDRIYQALTFLAKNKIQIQYYVTVHVKPLFYK